MKGLFLFILLASIVCLIIGLIQPKVFYRFLKAKANRKFIGLFFGGVIILSFVLFGVTSDTSKLDNKTTSNQTALKYAYDIPTLVGKNIDEVRQILGAPLDKALTEPTTEQKKLMTGTSADEWSNSYKKDNQELLVTFNPTTRKIIDFFLSGDNKTNLIEIGNLKSNDPRYVVEPVKTLNNSSSITGIKITPKQ